MDKPLAKETTERRRCPRLQLPPFTLVSLDGTKAPNAYRCYTSLKVEDWAKLRNCPNGLTAHSKQLTSMVKLGSQNTGRRS
jgi:hypothetical protein